LHFYLLDRLKLRYFRARRLGVLVGRVKQLIAEKRLPATKVGNTNLVKKEDLGRVEERRNGRPPKPKNKND
jgi:excisionase family DNA binding protein